MHAGRLISSYQHIMTVHLEITVSVECVIGGGWWGEKKHGMAECINALLLN